ncbi:MAG: methionine gamma-lyase family protein [Oscillospiraceae bacterium]|nr:methionine gamma-lyase family protein [Oscillospiraceae bacterium]MBR3001296.1 methionine gamma-lyase family protein [Oscillospiraceae bacterium]
MLFEKYGISADLCRLDEKIMAKCADAFRRCEDVRDEMQLKVLKAFADHRIGAQHFAATTGYGYGDIGRDALDAVFAQVVGAEDALCRPQFMSGTHTLTVALFGLLRTGDTLLAATGRPYDTLLPVIGLDGEGYGSLIEYGVKYDEVPLICGEPDYEGIAKKAKDATVIHIQRSRGYESRRAFSVEDIEKIAKTAKAVNPDVVIFVDNCYGEFCDTTEPIVHGADLMAGSLIKNGGGGIAPTGGYIAGRADLVEKCAHRMTAPGTGRELGCTPSGYREFYLGLYFAPSTTCEAKKSSIYAAALFEDLGYKAVPAYDAPRNDIITSLELGNPDDMVLLCEALQAASPIDSFATPVAEEMAGYADKIIMAAGAFTEGSSIELSCDGPLREPYVAYAQGGLSLTTSRYAYLRAAQKMLEKRGC